MPRAMKEQSAKHNHSRLRSAPVDLNQGNRYCDVCNKEFSRPSELKRHLANTLMHNPRARRFECKYCGSQHTQKSNLRIHERIHFNERKEFCHLPFDELYHKQCDFKCSDPSSMIRHIDNVHISPFIDHNLGKPILPSWLIKAIRKRENAKEATRRDESIGSRTPSTSPSPSPSSSPSPFGSSPHTPLPSSTSGKSALDVPSRSKAAHNPDNIDASRPVITDTYIPHPALPDPSLYPPVEQPTPQHADFGFDASCFNHDLPLRPDFPVLQFQQLLASSSLASFPSGPVFPPFSSPLEFNWGFPLPYEQLQVQTDQHNLTESPHFMASSFSDAPSRDLNFSTDGNTGFDGRVSLGFFSPGQVQMEPHDFV